jgi:hypothetical protein
MGQAPSSSYLYYPDYTARQYEVIGYRGTLTKDTTTEQIKLIVIPGPNWIPNARHPKLTVDQSLQYVELTGWDAVYNNPPARAIVPNSIRVIVDRNQ